MVKLYVKKITQDEMTLEQVPTKWREEVRKELEKLKKSGYDSFLDAFYV